MIIKHHDVRGDLEKVDAVHHCKGWVLIAPFMIFERGDQMCRTEAVFMTPKLQSIT